MRSHGTLISMPQHYHRNKGGGRGRAPGGGGAAGNRAPAPAAKIDGRFTRGLQPASQARLQNFANKGANAGAIKDASRLLRDRAEAQTRFEAAKTDGGKTRAQAKVAALDTEAKTRFPGL